LQNKLIGTICGVRSADFLTILKEVARVPAAQTGLVLKLRRMQQLINPY